MGSSGNVCHAQKEERLRSYMSVLTAYDLVRQHLVYKVSLLN